MGGGSSGVGGATRGNNKSAGVGGATRGNNIHTNNLVNVLDGTSIF